jgi:hypothetical protein
MALLAVGGTRVDSDLVPRIPVTEPRPTDPFLR